MRDCFPQHGSADAAAGMAEAEFEIVWGSVRVLSAWLAEETEALRTEVNGILPALLAWCAVDRRYVSQRCGKDEGPGQPARHPCGSLLVRVWVRWAFWLLHPV
jgi:hypothetical protein